ncbi:MAG: radical SAM protein [Fibromonadaceae bacterium]|nr:radical SAM protein [Fibromonadaceae bacterium]
MKYFLLSITNTCNKSCDYCVVKPWLNNPEFPDKATAQDFISFLSKEMRVGDVVEITGGEPTLFPELIKLLEFLKKNEAKVILRTNGALLDKWRADYENMVVVLAKHNTDDHTIERLKRYLLPQDLVIDDIPGDIMQKEQDKPIFKADNISPLKTHSFAKMFHVTNDGKVRAMSCSKWDMGTIWDYKPQNYLCCPKCPFMLGAWNLIARLKYFLFCASFFPMYMLGDIN